LVVVEEYRSKTVRSRGLYERACNYLPGGVTYAVKYWEPYPVYANRAKGSRVWDVDGNEYIDFWMGHFAIIMGHAYGPVLEAAREQIELGAHFGYCHEWEIEHAKIISEMSPCVDFFRATNSGTEANMYAIRLARAYTKRSKVGKFEGNWHGGYDALHKAVNPPLDKPPSLGLTEDTLKDTIVLPYNDIDGVVKIAKKEALACIVIEPVMGAGGFIPAEREFLKGLRELCDEEGILLIFDEVITGFRLARGGAQEYYGVVPDLAVFGKTIGGGVFPAGGFGGKAEIMELLDYTRGRKPYEAVFHGGTYAGNPLSTRAGYVVLSELKKGYVYPKIDGLGEKARKGLREIFDRYGVEAHVTGLCSVFGIHFTREKPRDVRTATQTRDVERCKRLFQYLISNGILFLKPDKPVFSISAAHSSEDVEKLLFLVEDFARKEARQG